MRFKIKEVLQAAGLLGSTGVLLGAFTAVATSNPTESIKCPSGLVITGDVTYGPEEVSAPVLSAVVDDTPEQISERLVAGPVIPGSLASIDLSTVVDSDSGTATAALRDSSGALIGLMSLTDSASRGWLVDHIEVCSP